MNGFLADPGAVFILAERTHKIRGRVCGEMDGYVLWDDRVAEKSARGGRCVSARIFFYLLFYIDVHIYSMYTFPTQSQFTKITAPSLGLIRRIDLLAV